MQENKQGLNVSVKSFLTAIAVVLLLMIATYILTWVVPGGMYARVTDAAGNLVLDPKLASCHFSSDGIAEITCRSTGRRLTVRYHKDTGEGFRIVCRENKTQWISNRIPVTQIPETATLDVILS